MYNSAKRSLIKKTFLNNIFTYLFIGIFGAFAIYVSNIWEFLAFTSVFIIFIIPGLIIIRKLFCSNLFENPGAIFLGTAIGLSISSLVVAIAGYFIVWSFLPLIGVLAAFSFVLNYVLGRHKEPILQVDVPTWTREDLWILFSFMILTLISLAPVYLNIGKPTSHGIAFTSLIGNDFVAHMNHTASISQGIPPQYLHFAGDILRYYWLSFVLPGLVYSLASQSFSLIDVMILNQSFLSVIFWGILYFTIKLFTKNIKVKIAIMFILFCAYSYKYFYVFLKYFANSFESNPIIILMKNRGLFEFSDLSQGFFRFYVFESQTLLGLALVLVCFFLIINYSDELPNKNVMLILLGLLTGLTFGIEILTGMLLACVIGFFIIKEIVSLYKGKKGFKAENVFLLFVPGLLAITIYAVYFIIGMFSFGYGSQSLTFRPNKLIILSLPIYLILEFGPLSFLGTVGIYKIIKNKSIIKKYYPFIILVIVSFFIILFLDTTATTKDNTGVVKGGRTIYLSLLFFSIFFLEDIISGKKNNVIKIFCFSIILIASPSLWIDMKTLSNVNNTKITRYIEKEDYEASIWVKNNTPRDSIIQSFADKSAYSIVTFGEKRMALGWDMALVALHDNIKGVPGRKKDNEEIFCSSNMKRVNELIKKYSINYVYVGPSDRKRIRDDGYIKFDLLNDYFEKVYSHDGVDIYKVKNDRVNKKAEIEVH